jgi:hypothetical protein
MTRALLVLTLVATPSFAGPMVDMYMLTVESATAQPIDDQQSLLDKARALPFVDAAKRGCMFKVPPKGVFEPWYQGSVTEAGKIKFDRLPKQGGAPNEVVECALLSILNTQIQLEPGRYRITLRVRFKKTRYEIR